MQKKPDITPVHIRACYRNYKNPMTSHCFRDPDNANIIIKDSLWIKKKTNSILVKSWENNNIEGREVSEGNSILSS